MCSKKIQGTTNYLIIITLLLNQISICLCQGLNLIKLHAEAWNFIKKETLAQVFVNVFLQNCKKHFFTEHLCTTASVHA